MLPEEILFDTEERMEREVKILKEELDSMKVKPKWVEPTESKLGRAANNAAMEICNNWKELNQYPFSRWTEVYKILNKHLSKEKFNPSELDDVP